LFCAISAGEGGGEGIGEEGAGIALIRSSSPEEEEDEEEEEEEEILEALA
jgi:hypothetical protein